MWFTAGSLGQSDSPVLLCAPESAHTLGALVAVTLRFWGPSSASGIGVIQALVQVFGLRRLVCTILQGVSDTPLAYLFYQRWDRRILSKSTRG